MTRAAAALLLLLATTTGCEDLSRFSTAPDESYCGAVSLGAAFRRGFTPRTQMRLVLDASRIDTADSPGTLWTRELVGDDEPEIRLLNGAPLRPIPPLAHDVLSRPDLGEGRERTAIYAVTPEDPDAEALVAFLSLRSDGDVEVRLLRPGASDDTEGIAEGRRPLFGLFSLKRQQGPCF
ncbi:MAG: hypothetical protein R3B70_06030 [Polyangiaceae bacterium]